MHCVRFKVGMHLLLIETSRSASAAPTPCSLKDGVPTNVPLAGHRQHPRDAAGPTLAGIVGTPHLPGCTPSKRTWALF